MEGAVFGLVHDLTKGSNMPTVQLRVLPPSFVLNIGDSSSVKPHVRFFGLVGRVLCVAFLSKLLTSRNIKQLETEIAF